jgi:hypothetical protein
MTIDETLDWLYRLRSNVGVYMPREWNMPMVKALDKAIKDLEQEPCETQMIDKSNFSQEQYKADLQSAYDCGKASVKPCEDAISREFLLLDLLLKAQGEKDVSIKWLEEYINSLPPVTPQSQTGHWIKVTNGRGGHECDLCHEYAPSYQSGDEYLPKYCPNCGAKMVEPQESEDKE